jgi:hypothetical protein
VKAMTRILTLLVLMAAPVSPLAIRYAQLNGGVYAEHLQYSIWVGVVILGAAMACSWIVEAEGR